MKGEKKKAENVSSHSPLDIEQLTQETEQNYGKNKRILLVMAVCSACLIILLYLFAPSLSESEAEKFFRFPRTPDDLRLIYEVMSRYAEERTAYVIV
jgi:hypothetical protein